MTDDNDQGGGYSNVPPDENKLAELIDRHNDLVQAWEDNEDPEVRSQISFEIRLLDAQINELTEPHNLVAEASPMADDAIEDIEAHPTGDWPAQVDQGSSSLAPPSDPSLGPAPPVVPSYEPPSISSAEIHNVGQPAETGLEAHGTQTEPVDVHRGQAMFNSSSVNDGPSGNGTTAGNAPDGAEPNSRAGFDDGPPVEHGEDRAEGLDRHRVFGQNGSGETAAFDRRVSFNPPSGQHKVFDNQRPVGQGDMSTEPSEQPQAPPPGPAFGQARPIGQDPGFAGGQDALFPQGRNPDHGHHEPPFDGGSHQRHDDGSAKGGSGLAGLPRGGSFSRPSATVLAVVGVCLALLAGVLWFGNQGDPNPTQASGPTTVSVDPAAPAATAQGVPAAIRSVLDGLGLTSVVVDDRDGVIHIGGPVPSQADYDAAANAVQAVAGSVPVDTSALVVMSAPGAVETAPPDGRSQTLQTELDRLLAATPLIFGSGQASLTELHQRILNNAVLVLNGYPGLEVTITGYTDPEGDEASNQGLSLSRAENVKAYLVGQGVSADALTVNAVGEQGSSGSEALARLERRVEFEVTGAGAAAAPGGDFRVAIVAPSASNDLAFTQSMVDAVNILSTEFNIELAVTDNTFVPDEAAAAVRSYAEQGYDLVIAHGSQFGASLIEIAPEFPETAFAWGTAADTFGLPNVYAYDAAAQEGGYVLGALASELSTSQVAGVVGPIEVGDAAQYVAGFTAGAQAQNTGTNVLTTYTGSFSDIALATETAQAHIGSGADVLTGSAQMVVGAVSAADQEGVLWFGTQANQASLAPSIVVASQVYHWEVALRPIFNDISAGTLAGTSYTANLANGGLVIEYNPDYPLDPEAKQRADQLAADIASGSVVPPG